MNAPILETIDLTTGYASKKRGRTIVSDHLSLRLIQGEVVCLIGPNGAGKSTLLRTLSGLQTPLVGTVRLNRRAISALSARELARSLSVVLTERVSVGALSVFTLVSLGRYPYTDWAGKLQAEDYDIVRWALQAVGAEALAQRNVNELSDGERQKVMIARALAQQPDVIILDEPTAFLDLPRRIELMNLLRHLSRETGTAILLSTHDLELALRTADLLWILPKKGQMHIGAPEDLVLSGELELAFKNDGVEFDRQHGAFVMRKRHNTHITLLGDGLHALWTQKALEREGFTVKTSPNGAPYQVRIAPPNHRPVWHLQTPCEMTEHDSIYELLTTLRKNMSQP